jgi:imidazole glycerol phosphate synthase glutamine amidotransferase subunit
MRAAIIDTGCANLPSVVSALRRIGLYPEVAGDGAAVLDAPLAVLPGVGSFGAAAQRLRDQDIEASLVERVAANRATLAICVGLQLLATTSDESPDVPGTGVLPARVGRYPDDVRVPHMGWNRVEGSWLEDGHAYFANSFRIGQAAAPELEKAGWEIAWTSHGAPFIAALRRGNVLACQFHPELSGDWGARLLRAWACREVASC